MVPFFDNVAVDGRMDAKFLGLIDGDYKSTLQSSSLTTDRTLLVVDEDGTLATREWSDARFVNLTTPYDDPGFVNTLTWTKITDAPDFLTVGDAAITYVPLSSVGEANGVVPLGADSKIASMYLPPIAITETFVVSSQAAMLALTAERGDVAVRTDLNKSFILTAEPASTLGNWQELLTPTDAVLSVNGQTGAVSITAASISAAPASGSANYIWNQSAAVQNPGALWIQSEIQSATALRVRRTGVGPTRAGGVEILTSNLANGAALQLDGDTPPGLRLWVHNGSTWVPSVAFHATRNISMGLENALFSAISRLHIFYNSPNLLYLQNTTAISSSLSDSNIGLWSTGLPAAAGRTMATIRMGSNYTGSGYASGATIAAISDGAWTTSASYPTRLVFSTIPVSGTNEVERITIKENGFVGIGTNGPFQLLHVQAGEIFVRAGATTNSSPGAGILFGVGNNAAGYSAIRAYRGLSDTEAGLSIFTSNSAAAAEVIRIVPNGFVGINNTDPQNELDVIGDAYIGQGAVGAGAGRLSVKHQTSGSRLRAEQWNGSNWISGVLTLDGERVEAEGAFTVSGTIGWAFDPTPKTTNFTASPDYGTYEIDNSGGAVVVVTLMAASDVTGRILFFKVSDSTGSGGGAVTIGGQLVDNVSGVVGPLCIVQSDGATWHFLQGF